MALRECLNFYQLEILARGESWGGQGERVEARAAPGNRGLTAGWALQPQRKGTGLRRSLDVP